jgi:uncharacterized repeat protein (TIGR04076 family)
MSDEKNINEFEEYSAGVLKAENKFYQEVTITQVDGVCPYGHREGDTFRVTAMNSDGICGSLLKAIFSEIATLHYGGSILWEKTPDTFHGCCPEKGRVHVEVKRVSQQEPVLFKTPFQYKNMTGKGFAALDTYRLLVEVRDIAVTCL